MPSFTHAASPAIVQATQWIGTNYQAMVDLGAELELNSVTNVLRLRSGVDGANGWITVPVGGWAVRRASNDFIFVSAIDMANNYQRMSL